MTKAARAAFVLFAGSIFNKILFKTDFPVIASHPLLGRKRSPQRERRHRAEALHRLTRFRLGHCRHRLQCQAWEAAGQDLPPIPNSAVKSVSLWHDRLIRPQPIQSFLPFFILKAYRLCFVVSLFYMNILSQSCAEYPFSSAKFGCVRQTPSLAPLSELVSLPS